MTNDYGILACPQCGGGLTQPAENVLRCEQCKLDYPVRSGIPLLLAKEGNETSYEKFTQTPTESIEFYEEFYKGHYDYKRFSASDKTFSKIILDRLKFNVPNPVIVDVGAGTGYFGYLFEQIRPAYQVYNADFSYEGFRTAQEVYGLTKLAVMDAYRVAFLPDTVDAVFSIGLTPFKKSTLQEVQFLIEQLIKPLKSGGYYVFIWSSNLRGTVDEIDTVRQDQEISRTYYYNHSRRFIEQAFAATGQFDDIQGFVFLRPFSMFLGGLLLSKPVTWFTELLMRFVPKSLTARIIVVGRKK